MAYKRTYRKTYRKRPVVGRKLQRTRKLAGQEPVTWAEKLARYAGPVGRIAATVSQIAGLVNSEVKYNDVHVSGVSVAADNQPLIYVNNIAQGDGESQRNGLSILDKSLQWNIRCTGDENATDTAVGYAMIMDKRPDEAITNSWSTVFNSSDPASLINKNYSDRFVILKRGEFMLDNSGQNSKYIKGYLNLKGIHTKYFDGTSNPTGIYANSIFLTATSDHTDGSSQPHLEGQIRYQYYDN